VVVHEQIFTKCLHWRCMHMHVKLADLYVRLPPCTGTGAPVLVMRAHEL
jgi:hypothetical protein